MTIDLTPEQVRWLGGLLRSFCSDEIYELDGDALKERFLHLLDCEMRSDRVDEELSTPRAQLELCSQVADKIAAIKERGEYYPGYGTVEAEAEKKRLCELNAAHEKEQENGNY